MNDKELTRIISQLTASMEGNAWHGPAVLELIEDINDEEASAKPLRDAHNIFELTAHITAWQKAGIRRINGDPARLTDQEDWPMQNDASEEQWSNTKKELISTFNLLKSEIKSFPPEHLDENIEGLDQTFYTLFHGIVQHNIYHAGQIAILKKAIRTSYI
jgi:uncharacterized damage-inducible protein DinB